MPVKVKNKRRPLGRLLKERVLPRLKQATVWLKKKKPYTIDGQDLTDDIEVTPPWIRRVAIGIAVGLFLALNYLGTVLYLALPLAVGKLMGKEEAVTAWAQQRPISLVNVVRLRLPVWVYPFLLCVCLGIALLVYHKLSFKFRTLVKGQKGDNRLAELAELKDQYPAVPDRKKTFPGIGGVPISHFGNQYLIDQDTVNTTYVGNARSGKDQIYAIPKIDILSRAEEKVSMVLNDAKGDMYAAAKIPLEERGYDVQVLNLKDPMESLSYQLLELVVRYWTLKDYDRVQLLVTSLTYSLYHDSKASGNANHFNETAQGVVSAIILALLEECDKKKELWKVTMYNVTQFLVEMGNWKAFNPMTKQEKRALDQYFEDLPAGSLAKMQYASANFAESREKGSILSTAMRKLKLFQLDSVAKMTSTSSFDFKRLGFPNDLVLTLSDSTDISSIKVYFSRGEKVLGVETVRPSRHGAATLNFPYDLKTNDQVTFRSRTTKGKVYRATYAVTMPEELDDKQIPLTEVFSDFPTLQTVTMTCQRKPLAIFMIIPDADSSLHAIASIFVGQSYQELVRNADSTRGNACHRRVNYIFNEFGNMVPIFDFDRFITAGLSRNILFDLYVQSLGQFTESYGRERGDTIFDNCQNQIYIMSKDDKTIERFQKRTGKRTVKTRSSNETALSMNNSATTNIEGEYLLTQERLGTLIMGETLVLRTLHRLDTKGRKIRPYPIFNTKETSMPYTYEFLADDFDTKRDVSTATIRSRHWDMDLSEQRIDVRDYFSWGAVQGQTSDAPVQEKEDDTLLRQQLEDVVTLIRQKLRSYLASEEEIDALITAAITTTGAYRPLLAKSVTDSATVEELCALFDSYKVQAARIERGGK